MDSSSLLNIEKSLLSSFLFNPITIEKYLGTLTADDFYLPAHKEIYRTMTELFQEDIPFDEEFIKRRAKDISDSILIEILSANPITNEYAYVKEVKEQSQRRKLEELSIQIKSRLQDENSSVDDVFNTIKEHEEDIRTSGLMHIQKSSILDAQEREADFICKNFIPLPRRTLSMISAPGGTGKTWVAVQAAMNFVLENPKKKCFLWLSEDEAGIVKQRLKSIASSILLQTVDKFENIHITDSDPVLLLENYKGNKKISSKFNQFKSELREYDFIIFDPLLAFYGGDENDNSQARIFMQPFMNWAKKEDKVITFLHHSAKNIIQNNQNKSRGAGAFVDAVRVCYEIDKIYLSDNKTLDKSKLHQRNIKLSKDNYGAIKYLKEFNIYRDITPRETSQSYSVVETEFLDDIL